MGKTDRGRLMAWSIALVLSTCLIFVGCILAAILIGGTRQTEIVALGGLNLFHRGGVMSKAPDTQPRLILIDLLRGLEHAVRFPRYDVLDVYPLDDPNEVLIMIFEPYPDEDILGDLSVLHLDLDDGGIHRVLSVPNEDHDNARYYRRIGDGNRLLHQTDGILGIQILTTDPNTLYTYDVNAHQTLGKITPGHTNSGFPTWSSPQERIALMQGEHLHIYPYDGSGNTTLDVNFPYDNIAWSKDGRRLLLTSKHQNLDTLPLKIINYPAGQVDVSRHQPQIEDAYWVCDRIMYTTPGDLRLYGLDLDDVDPALDDIAVIELRVSPDCEWVLLGTTKLEENELLTPMRWHTLYAADSNLQRIRKVADIGIIDNLMTADGFYYRELTDAGDVALMYQSWDASESFVAIERLPSSDFPLISISEAGLIYRIRTANFTNGLILRDRDTGVDRYLTDPHLQVQRYVVW